MHENHPPTKVRVDFARVAQLELEIYGQTFHHFAPGCFCEECRQRRSADDRRLHEQTREGWDLEHAKPLWDHFVAEESAQQAIELASDEALEP